MHLCREQDEDRYEAQTGKSHYFFQMTPRSDFEDNGVHLTEGEVRRQHK
jgi:hypothetical protein